MGNSYFHLFVDTGVDFSLCSIVFVYILRTIEQLNIENNLYGEVLPKCTKHAPSVGIVLKSIDFKS